ncbi:antibiotic biosynthesis monooxygenase family protein [Neisseria flavescens]|uniref:antibiotic biosynthesis monooxygenase family protein n=1 Tax=Neisseria flavescens TaxID=484 RepID=UPI000A85D353|nr:antibiotic biosynthesis monooxygenase family protein [Neisseria flavescens]
MNTRKKTIIAAITTAVLLCAGGCTAKAEQWRSKREAMQNSVVLINTFEVPQGKEAEALAAWQKARDFLKTQPGYISTRLHQNIDPNGKYHLVNVARWRSAEDFKATAAKMNQALPNNKPEGVTASPGLFKVIESDMPQGFGRRNGKGFGPKLESSDK